MMAAMAAILKFFCYDRALLLSIICLGRLRIASKYIFNLWQLCQWVDSLAQWLEHWIFNREDRVRFPRQAWEFFQLCFISLLRLSCHKMGAHSIICLGRLRIASKYIFNLWQLHQGVDSLAQWLEHWIFNREDRVRFPGKTEYFFSYASFLCYDFHVVRLQTTSPPKQ